MGAANAGRLRLCWRDAGDSRILPLRPDRGPAWNPGCCTHFRSTGARTSLWARGSRRGAANRVDILALHHHCSRTSSLLRCILFLIVKNNNMRLESSIQARKVQMKKILILTVIALCVAIAMPAVADTV